MPREEEHETNPTTEVTIQTDHISFIHGTDKQELKITMMNMFDGEKGERLRHLRKDADRKDKSWFFGGKV